MRLAELHGRLRAVPMSIRGVLRRGAAMRWPFLLPAMLALVVVGALAVVVVSRLPAERSGGIAAAWASSALEREVAIEDASFAVWPVPAVVLHGVTISDPPRTAGVRTSDADPGTLADVGRVRLEAWRQQLAVQRVVLEPPAVRVAVDASGHANLPALQPVSAESGRRLEFLVRWIDVRDGRLAYSDARTGADLRATGTDHRRRLDGAWLAGLAELGAEAPPPAAGFVGEPFTALATTGGLIDDGDTESLRLAVERSLNWLRQVPADRQFAYGRRTVTAREKIEALRELSGLLERDPEPAALGAWVDERFDVVELGDERPGEVLVTGYFEPVIAGSPVRTERARVPVYGRPADLAQRNPYFTRHQIQEQGALAGRGLEIAWVEDRVDLFFVQVQGSGAIRFPDGRELRIGYDGTNGHSYRSIGRLLIDEGHIPAERMSMQAIRHWLDANPLEVARVLDHNPSYVFFRVLDSPPLGALGEPVVPGRSIATDLQLFPRGALAFLETTRPELDAEGNVVAGPPLRRFVLNHDAGSAIRGFGRVDFFWGRGPDAERLAGLMRQPGRLKLLVPAAH